MTEEYKEEYKKARKAAMKQYRTCASRGWSLYPPVLDEVSAYVKTAGEEVLGEMEIPLSLVTGTRTAGRQNAFSKDFLPILPENSEFARKWIPLYTLLSSLILKHSPFVFITSLYHNAESFGILSCVSKST